MRQIKLRAWDIKGNQYWGSTEGDWKIELHDGQSPQLFIFDYECEHGSWIEIEDVVFEEYTGLKDKNGAEIFEGDILTSDDYPYQDKGKYNYHGVIEWIDEWASFGITKRLANSEKRGISDGISEQIEDVSDFEVIGNIHDNPELLEVAE